jgi:5-formyltetrahydrofolate cyclo-ligase
MNNETIAAEKAALRRLMRERRATLAPEARIAAALAVRDRLIGWLATKPLPRGSVVSGYWPIRGELDPRPALQALAERGHRLALPVSIAHGEPLAFRAWSPGEPLALDIMRIEAPFPSAPMLRPDLLLVPMLAFDSAGRRLGYGAGFYDRTLTALRRAGRVTAVGLAFSAQEVAQVPAGPNDAALDAVVTEARVIESSEVSDR